MATVTSDLPGGRKETGDPWDHQDTQDNREEDGRTTHTTTNSKDQGRKNLPNTIDYRRIRDKDAKEFWLYHFENNDSMKSTDENDWDSKFFTNG